MKRSASIAALLQSVLWVSCLVLALPSIRAQQQKPIIYVASEYNVFYAPSTSVGVIFNVNITTADWTAPGVFAYEARLYYDNALLEATDAQFPKNHWLEPSTPIIYIEPPHPYIYQDQGFVVAAFSLLGPEPGRTGGGTLFTVIFKMTQTPPAGQRVSCTLELRDVVMVDPDATVISLDRYAIVNGNYVFSDKEDLNLDGRVNILDMAILAKAYGSSPGDATWNLKADMNGDNQVNVVDFSAVARAWTG
jgi:hypothetical protein